MPGSVSIPGAEPPDDMQLIAVPTGVNNRVAGYAYRGGSVCSGTTASIAQDAA